MSPSPITITELPFFDVELIGVPVLSYVGSQQLVDNPSFQHLMEDDKIDEPKVFICGGKGGVGKSKLVFQGYLNQYAKADTSLSCCCQLNST